jgi:hypothetical protein
MPGDLLRIDGELVMVADREPSPEIIEAIGAWPAVSNSFGKFILIGQRLRGGGGPNLADLEDLRRSSSLGLSRAAKAGPGRSRRV